MAHFILIILLHLRHADHGHHYGQHKHDPAPSCVVRIRGVYYRPGVVFCPTPTPATDDSQGNDE